MSEELLVALAVEAGGDAGYPGSPVVEWQIPAAGVQAGKGHQHVDIVAQPRAPACTAFALRGPLLPGRGELRSPGFLAGAGDDVDHAEHRVLSIHRAAGAGNEFDAFDQVHVEREVAAMGPLVE